MFLKRLMCKDSIFLASCKTAVHFKLLSKAYFKFWKGFCELDKVILLYKFYIIYLTVEF
jgi:hypothetical protein